MAVRGWDRRLRVAVPVLDRPPPVASVRVQQVQVPHPTVPAPLLTRPVRLLALSLWARSSLPFSERAVVVYVVYLCYGPMQ